MKIWIINNPQKKLLSASCVLDAVSFDVFVDAEEDSQRCVVSGPAFAAVSCFDIISLCSLIYRLLVSSFPLGRKHTMFLA